MVLGVRAAHHLSLGMAPRVRRIPAQSTSASATEELQRWRELKDAEIRQHLLGSPDAPVTTVREPSYVLYRFYDVEHVLLYVGVTGKLSRRIKQHESTKSWWHKVASIKIERFPSQTDVFAAEKFAIVTEGPIYNGSHNHGRPQWRRL